MTDTNETVPPPPRSTHSSNLKGNYNVIVTTSANIPTGISSITTAATTTTTTTPVIGGGGNHHHRQHHLSSRSSPHSSPSSSSHRRKKHREDSDSRHHVLDNKESISSSPPPGGVGGPPSYQYQQAAPHQYQRQSSSPLPSSSILGYSSSAASLPSGHHHHRHNVTSGTDLLDGKATGHHGKKHGRSSHQQHHVSGRTAAHPSDMTGGDIGNNLGMTGNEYTKDELAPTSDVQEAIRNLLTSVDPASSAASSASSSSPPPPGQHRHPQTNSRSSSSSPTRYNTSSHASATSSTGGGGTPKVSHKKILPPSPIVVDSPSRAARRKPDGVVPPTTSVVVGSPGSMGGAKPTPTYSCSPPVVPPHASSSCPSTPPPIGRYTQSGYSSTSGSGTSAPTSTGTLSSIKKDDIVLPPTRSTASVKARTCHNTPAITTVATSVVSGGVTTTFSSRSRPDFTKPYSPPGSGGPVSVTSSVISKSSRSAAYKDKVGDNSDSGGPNFYKTNQKLAEIIDARPKYKTFSGNNCSVASAGYSSGGNRSGYSSIGNNKSSLGKSKKSSHHHSHSNAQHPSGGKSGDASTVNTSNKNSNYNRGYRSLEKENTGSYGGYLSLEKDNNTGSYGGYVTGYSNTIGSCGLGGDQNTGYDDQHNAEPHHQQQESSATTAEGKSASSRPSSKDHVYYTADRPSRRNLPTSGGSSHRASSVPARRSMSVSEFAGTSVDPEPENGQSDGENLEKVKSKLMSMWNNVKYGWTLNRKTSFRYDSPIFLLGEHYHRRHIDETDGKNKEERQHSNMDLFKSDFASRLWFTYRRDFEPLKGTKLTTDCGWGCMIRSGQMMLAQAFITHFFGRSWRFQNRDRGLNVYRQIIKWFADYQQCPFSVHQLVEIGGTLGRKPGEWYGPATVATMLREAMEKSYEFQPVLRELCVYVATDCTVYLQEVADLCMSGNNNTLVKMPNGGDDADKDASVDAGEDTTTTPESGTAGSWKRAVIVLIPVRLGGESLNSVYIPCLQNLLAEEHCIGIIGGKPKHSLYFVGWQDKKLIYLDPHYCQDNVDVMSGDFTFSSFHCITPRKLPFEDMDPSCTIGFYCRNQEEFQKFVNQTRDQISSDLLFKNCNSNCLKKLATNPKQKGLYPAFAFVEGRSCDLQMDKLELNKERYLRIRYVDQDGKQKLPANENDDFVVL